LVPETDSLILLVGENHASVKTQKELVDLITRLLNVNALNSILIEGSNGPVDSRSASQRVQSTGVSDDSVNAYWQEQLDHGLIAGYEYVALTRPGIEVTGVEDMAAKARYAVFLTDKDLRQNLESNERATDVLQRSLNIVKASGQQGDIRYVEAEIRSFRDAASSFAKSFQEVLAKSATMDPLEVQLESLRPRALALLRPLEDAHPSINEYYAWLREFEKLADPIRKRLRELQDRGIPTSAIERDFNFAAIRAKLNSLDANIKSFESTNRESLETFNSVYTRLRKLSEEIEKGDKELAPVLEQVKTCSERVEDAFFIAANHLRSLAEKYGAAIPGLMSFYHDEIERSTKENPANSKLELAERDTAMVENTVAYLKSRKNQKIVLLIVGYAHLPGLEEKLSGRQISYISGELTASEGPIERWEQAAWDRRQNAGKLIFSHEKMKEISSLLNENWKIEQAAKLDFFQKLDLSGSTAKPSILGLAWEGRVYENIGGEPRAIRIGKFPFDPNAQYGSYMIDRGSVPGKNGEYYEIIDRQVAAEEVKKRSDVNTSFVFAYRTVPSGQTKAVYKLETSAGPMSFADFVSAPPRSSTITPKRVVLFGEADEVSNGKITFSPLWEELRKPRGEVDMPSGGAGKPPGGGGEPPGGASKPPGGGSEPPGGAGKPPGGGGEPPGGAGKPPGDDGRPPGGGGKPPNSGDFFHDDHWLGGFWDLTQHERPQLLRTINPARAKQNLIALDRQEAAHLGPISFFDESDLHELNRKLNFTPQRGDNAQVVVLVGRNVPELRSAVRAAGESKLLKGKQVALIMCGDSFGETESLRESLLNEGALMVWTNDRQISYEAGLRLREHVRAVGEVIPPSERKTIDQLMNRALFRWHQEKPNDPNLPAFQRAASYVLIDGKPGRWVSRSSLCDPSDFRNFPVVESNRFVTLFTAGHRDVGSRLARTRAPRSLEKHLPRLDNALALSVSSPT
jgi:hypothetical protein